MIQVFLSAFEAAGVKATQHQYHPHETMALPTSFPGDSQREYDEHHPMCG